MSWPPLGEALTILLFPWFAASKEPKVASGMLRSYARSWQYLQNIFNATTPLPSSRWKVADPIGRGRRCNEKLEAWSSKVET